MYVFPPLIHLSFLYFCAGIQPKAPLNENGVAAPKSAPEDPPPQLTHEALSRLNSHLALIYASLPSRTAFVVFTGHSDPREMVALQARKNEFDGALKAGKTPEDVPRELWWTAADGRALEEAVERTKRGLLLLCLK